MLTRHLIMAETDEDTLLTRLQSSALGKQVYMIRVNDIHSINGLTVIDMQIGCRPKFEGLDAFVMNAMRNT